MAREYRTGMGEMRADSRDDDDLIDEDEAVARSLARLDRAWQHVPAEESDVDPLDEDAAMQRRSDRLDQAWRGAVS